MFAICRSHGKLQTWNDWLEEHLELHDGNAERVRLRSADFTGVMAKGKVGTLQFYAIGSIEPDTEYTFVYYPQGPGGTGRYGHTFTAQKGGTSFERARFEPVGRPLGCSAAVHRKNEAAGASVLADAPTAWAG